MSYPVLMIVKDDFVKAKCLLFFATYAPLTLLQSWLAVSYGSYFSEFLISLDSSFCFKSA